MTGPFQSVHKQFNPLGSIALTRGTGRYTFGLALSAGLAGLLYGYDTVSISGAIDFLDVRYHLSPALEGTIVSSIMFGGIIGATFAGFLSDRYGRRRLLMAGAGLFFFASLLSSLTLGPATLIAARAIGGIGIGFAASLAVVYITESAPTHIRGTLAFSYQMLAVCGIFLTNVINYVIASHGDFIWNRDIGWRWMLGIGAVPAAIFFLAMLRAPESPRFLIKSGQYERGFKTLEHIFGTDQARSLADDIADSVRFEKSIGTSVRDLLKPGLRNSLLAGVFLAVANQAIGMNVISYYGPTMLNKLRFFGDTDFLAAACVAGIELVFTVIGMYLIDAVGRKQMMKAGCALMCVFAIGLSFGYATGSNLLAFVSMMLFTASFAFSMGPIPWLMIPELFPNHLRGRATGICTAFLLAANWAVGQFTPVLIDGVGAEGTFLLFAVLDAACLFGVNKLPETMDRTLEDIERYWKPNTPQAAAQFAIDKADMRIRQAESQLALVENERMQALGIIEQAERDRVSAQKELFAIENDRMRRELESRLYEYKRSMRMSRLAEQNTMVLDHVPGPNGRTHGNAEAEPAANGEAGQTGGMVDVTELSNDAVTTVAVSLGHEGDKTSPALVRAAAPATAMEQTNPGNGKLTNTSGGENHGIETSTAEASGIGMDSIHALLDADFGDVDLSELDNLPNLPRIPEPASVRDEAELRRENDALHNALSSLDELIAKNNQ